MWKPGTRAANDLLVRVPGYCVIDEIGVCSEVVDTPIVGCHIAVTP